MPRTDKKVVVGGRVAPEVLDRLTKIAEAREWTVSYVVSKALTEWSEANAPPDRRKR